MSAPKANFDEVMGMESSLQMLTKKRNALRQRLLLVQGTDAAQEFKLEEQILQTEAELEKLKKELSELYSLNSKKGQSLLQDKLSDFEFEEEVGLWHRVNCDRRKIVRRFWDTFDDLQDLLYQFYFITACPTQMPPSFAERMVYELIRDELDDDDSAIFRLRKENDRVKILDLPLRNNLERSKRKFKKSFGELFEFKKLESFDQFIHEGLPKLNYDLAVLLFEINEKNCEPHLFQFLEWIIETFSHTHQDVPRFLFFIVVYVDGLHTPLAEQARKKALVGGMKSLADKHKAAAHFQPLQPVEKSDLFDWLRDLGERNQAKLDNLITHFITSLWDPSDLEQFQKDGTFNMDDVELLQELVCDYIERTEP